MDDPNKLGRNAVFNSHAKKLTDTVSEKREEFLQKQAAVRIQSVVRGRQAQAILADLKQKQAADLKQKQAADLKRTVESFLNDVVYTKAANMVVSKNKANKLAVQKQRSVFKKQKNTNKENIAKVGNPSESDYSNVDSKYMEKPNTSGHEFLKRKKAQVSLKGKG